MRGLIAAGEVAACHDLADGGLLVALAEMVLASGIGADLELPPDCDAGWLFGEDQGRYLLAVAPDRLEVLLETRAPRRACSPAGSAPPGAAR